MRPVSRQEKENRKGRLPCIPQARSLTPTRGHPLAIRLLALAGCDFRRQTMDAAGQSKDSRPGPRSDSRLAFSRHASPAILSRACGWPSSAGAALRLGFGSRACWCGVGLQALRVVEPTRRCKLSRQRGRSHSLARHSPPPLSLRLLCRLRLLSCCHRSPVRRRRRPVSGAGDGRRRPRLMAGRRDRLAVRWPRSAVLLRRLGTQAPKADGGLLARAGRGWLRDASDQSFRPFPVEQVQQLQ